MSDRFYRQRDKLTMNNQPLPPDRQTPKGYISTYYELVNKQKKARLEETKAAKYPLSTEIMESIL